MARHAWKGCCVRNSYAVLWAPRMDRWVRVVYFAPDEYVLLDLENRVLT